jgi:PPM family protein phosphatase
MNKYAITDIGKIRETNQDQAFVYTNKNRNTIGIVCDGMGGHKAGAFASLLTSKVILDEFIEAKKFANIDEAKKWLHDTIMLANKKVRKKSESDENFEGMGTTACVALVVKKKIIVANVGDSRCYVLHNDKLKLITEDQTYVNILLKKGKITSEQAINHPDRHVLMYAVGTMEKPQIDINVVNNNNVLVMLCSDGIYNVVSEKYIKTILDSSLPIDQKAISIINDGNQNGGYDNMSIVLLEGE